jgi:hypothetical protein
MTKAQAATLKRLAEEVDQPNQYQPNLSKEEAARRIDALKREIELADSY